MTNSNLYTKKNCNKKILAIDVSLCTQHNKRPPMELPFTRAKKVDTFEVHSVAENEFNLGNSLRHDVHDAPQAFSSILI
jgi:hypothetical protein